MDAFYTGEKIRELRKEKGLTQKDLADLLNVTNKSVSKWECGKNYPDIALFQPLSEALGTTVSELLGVEQPITNETIAVLSAISHHERKAIKWSLYQFIITAMIASTLYLVFRINVAEHMERWLVILNFVVLVNGGAILEYLYKKFSGKNHFRWPSSQDNTVLNHLKISVSLWFEKLRRK